MPGVVQVDSGQLTLVQNGANLLERMLGDPRTAEQAEKLVETLNPSAEFPLRRQREAVLTPVMAELEKERARVAALEAKWAEREAKDREREEKAQETDLARRLSAIQAKRGFSDETMQKVMNRMREENNPDIEAAAAWVSESLPRPGPMAGHDYLPSTVDPFGTASDDAAWANLHKNPTRWQDDELRSIIRDPDFLRLGNAA